MRHAAVRVLRRELKHKRRTLSIEDLSERDQQPMKPLYEEKCETSTLALQGGLNNSVTCPQLPDYVYAYHFRIVIRIWFWAPNDLIWVPYSSWEYNPVSDPPALDWTNDWYAVFDDPNVTSFPPYKVGGADRTVPWYQIIANALNHVTTSGVDQTVTQDSVAMTNLTTDLYVWNPSLPNNGRPNGPGPSTYNGGAPAQYYLYDPLEKAIVFDLWGMKLSTNGDCRDFSAFLESEAGSLGISGVTKRHLGEPYGGGFTTNSVIFCGSSLAAPTSFSYHRMVSWVGGIYDFALAFNYSDGVHPWKLATGSDPGGPPPPPPASGTYYADLVAGWPSSPPDWSPTSFSLGETDPRFGYATLVK